MKYKQAILKNLEKLHNRKICLWSCGVLEKNILQALVEMDISVSYCIGDYYEEFSNKCNFISSINDLDGSAKEYFIFVAVYSGHKEIVEILQKLGYKYNVDFVITNISLFVKDLDMIDPLLTYSRDEDLYPGIVSFDSCSGKENQGSSYKVLILGNSTSEASIGGMKCWAYFLQKELCNALSQDVIVYNGAISGYNSGQEFLKLARDGLSLEPNIVISFSGVNDVEMFGTTIKDKLFLHKYQYRMWNNILSDTNRGVVPDSLYMRNMSKLSTGIAISKSNSEVWIENERKMYALCHEFKVDFMACLQPMITQGDYIIDEEMNDLLIDAGLTKNYEKYQKDFVCGVRKYINKYQYMRDLTTLFDNKTDLYFDNYHYNEKGNQIIASYVTKMIIEGK